MLLSYIIMKYLHLNESTRGEDRSAPGALWSALWVLSLHLPMGSHLFVGPRVLLREAEAEKEKERERKEGEKQRARERGRDRKSRAAGQGDERKQPQTEREGEGTSL